MIEYHSRPPLHILAPPEPKAVPFDLNVGRATSRVGTTAKQRRISGAFDTRVTRKMVKTNEPMSDDIIKVESISITTVELRDQQRAKTALTMRIRQGFNAADSRPPTPRLSNSPYRDQPWQRKRQT